MVCLFNFYLIVLEVVYGFVGVCVCLGCSFLLVVYVLVVRIALLFVVNVLFA